MTSLNRGEWSELYSILFLLVKPRLKLVDANLKEIEEAKDLFVLKEIISRSTVTLRYELIEDTVMIFIDGSQFNKMSVQQIEKSRQILIDEIKNASGKRGAFTIPTINEFLTEFSNNSVFKTGSQAKDDIELVLIDNKQAKRTNLSYSIKSSLGSPATILNASNNTNFKYKITGINQSDISSINAINSKTKLLDRINKIEKLGGKITFDSVPSDTFEYNLKMVDSNMPDYLGNALLYSYQNNNKDLKTIFINSNSFKDNTMALKKLGDLINAISFGFFPGVRWNGKNTVTGGLVIVKETGEVCVLDLIYYKEDVQKYLINESKLDSPSSTRYHMLDLFEENGEICFTLNLQIRYKR